MKRSMTRHNRIWPVLIACALILPLAFGCGANGVGDALPDDTDLNSDYHPEGWTAPASHGMAFLDIGNDCGFCHGETLMGQGVAVSCDTCHSGWQNDCTFCHGGSDENPTPAPPPTVDGSDKGRAHLAHVLEPKEYPCSTCHVVPDSIFSEGHLDASPGAEIVFGALAGEGAGYDNGTCSAVYCHGGTSVSWTGPPMKCTSCHGDETARTETLSGYHKKHLEDAALTCSKCHGDVIGDDRLFVDESLHINGSPDIKLVFGDWDPANKTCTNTCHGPEPWIKNGNDD